MIIHHRFFPQRLALLRGKGKAHFRSIFARVFLQLLFIEIQQRFAAVRAISIRPASHLHLEQTQIEPHL